MCYLCTSQSPHLALRRTFLLAAASAAATPVLAQVDVGKTSAMARLVPAGTLEKSAAQQYSQMVAEAKAQGALAPPNHAQLQRLEAQIRAERIERAVGEIDEAQQPEDDRQPHRQQEVEHADPHAVDDLEQVDVHGNRSQENKRPGLIG